MGPPRVSTILFAIAALIGPGIGSAGTFTDMTTGDVLAAGLAVMSYFGYRELLRSKAVM